MAEPLGRRGGVSLAFQRGSSHVAPHRPDGSPPLPYLDLTVDDFAVAHTRGSRLAPLPSHR